MRLIRDLRQGVRRAGRYQPAARRLDLPEVGLGGILDADKEVSCAAPARWSSPAARAARNVDGRVLDVCRCRDRVRFRATLAETGSPRTAQLATMPPTALPRQRCAVAGSILDDMRAGLPRTAAGCRGSGQSTGPRPNCRPRSVACVRPMLQAAAALEFEQAAELRDRIVILGKTGVGLLRD